MMNLPPLPFARFRHHIEGTERGTICGIVQIIPLYQPLKKIIGKRGKTPGPAQFFIRYDAAEYDSVSWCPRHPSFPRYAGQSLKPCWQNCSARLRH